MIATMTLNPSIDYIIKVEDFKEGEINRTIYEHLLPGGKGLNVSIVLKNLGHESTAFGFVSGFTGIEIERRLSEFGVKNDFVNVKDGYSRINVKMRSKCETEINGMGPKIDEEEINQLFAKLDGLKENDILVISGSVPVSLPKDIYKQILDRLKDKGILFVVDSSGELLSSVLEYKPFLIKPNNLELAELFNTELNSREDVIPYAKKLQEKGARNVLVSLSEKGAVLLSEDGKVFMSDAPKGELVNSVGAGDSMLAGFIAGYLEKNDYKYAFYKGLCAGSASAFSADLADQAAVDALMDSCPDGLIFTLRNY
ncbi:MAG: 1-phosphofructokinase [Erysipelotrichaceae bacterium]|nr:1-phosphofructokinase [Erysipelotrichaceae bacterium]